MGILDLRQGDCLEVLQSLDDASVDAVVTDPPYGLSFMGSKWDYDVPSKEIWEQCLRVLKPGGHLLAFAGTRTQHRMCVNIEDAGFEIRDMIAWVYGSGFPKSLHVGRSLQAKADTGQCSPNAQRRAAMGEDYKPSPLAGTPDYKTFGNVGIKNIDSKQLELTDEAAQQWDGWGTALKPALEPITVARKPFKGTVANNVLTHGTGAINIDGCRVQSAGGNDYQHGVSKVKAHDGFEGKSFSMGEKHMTAPNDLGRWPANLIHDGSDEVTQLFPHTSSGSGNKNTGNRDGLFGNLGKGNGLGIGGDSGSAARFFYCAKANKKDREDGNTHPTVKPTDLMAYLCRLVTPPGGIILDPFMGSGSTGKAAMREGFSFIGIEREAEYYAIAQQRVKPPEQPDREQLAFA